MCRSFSGDLSCPQSAMLAWQSSRYSRMRAPHDNNWKWLSVTTTTFQKQRFTATIWSRLRTWCSDMQQRENHVVFMWEEMKTPLTIFLSLSDASTCSEKSCVGAISPRVKSTRLCRHYWPPAHAYQPLLSHAALQYFRINIPSSLK